LNLRTSNRAMGYILELTLTWDNLLASPIEEVEQEIGERDGEGDANYQLLIYRDNRSAKSNINVLRENIPYSFQGQDDESKSAYEIDTKSNEDEYGST
jgi:hypothetical protein